MLFSIITPSFRSAKWLKLCIASVADQGVEHEHIVQDSCSDDGTQEWLPKDPRVTAIIEKDQGMYDAVNRGLRRAQGDILAYLNCDEQFLPGALQAVREYFASHPNIDLVFSDTVVVDTQGAYLCHRQPLIPHKHHTLVCYNLGYLTCSMFFRRSLLDRYDLYFDPKWKDLGDAEWYLRALEKKVPTGLFHHFTAVFTETGANMNLMPNALREGQQMYHSAPAWARVGRPLLRLHHRLRRLLAGHYRCQPFSYSLYTLQSPEARVTHHVNNPTFQWKRAAGA